MSSFDEDITKSGLSPDLVGPRIGPYALIREIGSGGMGTVFLAVRNDDAFRKRVALKVLTRGMDTDSPSGDSATSVRFSRAFSIHSLPTCWTEAPLQTARSISRMEYVEGQRIVDYCESRGLDTTARIELFQKVCSAVQYAHQNLIIHRDIKPANVLVTPPAVY